MNTFIKYIKKHITSKNYHFARIGTNCIVPNNCEIILDSMIEIGDNVKLGVGTTLYAVYKKIIFGNNIMLGPHVTMISGDHNIYKVGVAMIDNNNKEPQDDAEIHIEDEVWIGANVTVLKGVTIGRGSVIAAGAVVVKSIPPYSIAGGLPAKVLKPRFTINQILQHEKAIYTEKYRFSREYLMSLSHLK